MDDNSNEKPNYIYSIFHTKEEGKSRTIVQGSPRGLRRKEGKKNLARETCCR